MSVDGEEAGLTGSTYYTNHPLVPKDKVIAILNLEQVGGSLLVVSQFTLYADTSSRRPGFTGAARPDLCASTSVH